MKLSVAVVCVVLMIASVQSMDVGTGGVYDSPFATDILVRQYGFMFGGGRSGLMGLKAMQERTNRMYKFPTYAYIKPRYQAVTVAPKSVELAPLVMKDKASQPKMFHRFMAVP
eukprot:TRINITY_DN1871_c0_g1_i1.p1 TRINITY_DN1871_c0_g1~~TRINITY_DN1871_c0_g1_i1.p1  ORF type:complete len:113 (+),score=33.26 TRINITY_DN1871_c0_g1_i1:113-451(+)